MKKIGFTPVFLLSLLLVICLSTSTQANIIVKPLEQHITMKQTWIQGNTSKKITVINNNPYEIFVEPFVKHPDPEEWRRATRTNIQNLSWISFEPEEATIPANGTGSFYIYFSIPSDLQEENLKKQWESWIAVRSKSGGQGMFNIGYLVRTYIDTPSSIHTAGLTISLWMIIAAPATILIAAIAAFLFFKNKDEKDIISLEDEPSIMSKKEDREIMPERQISEEKKTPTSPSSETDEYPSLHEATDRDIDALIEEVQSESISDEADKEEVIEKKDHDSQLTTDEREDIGQTVKQFLMTKERKNSKQKEEN